MYSVCIATSGLPEKQKHLRLTIRSIKAQSLHPDQIIVVINNEISKKLLEGIKKQNKGVIFIVAIDKKNNVSYARNIAANHCNSEYIVFLDDDTVLGNIDIMKKMLDNSSSYDFSCGAKRLWAPSSWEDILSESNQITYNMNLLSKVAIEPVNLNRNIGKQKLSNYSFIGNFGIIKKYFFQKSGGFDEQFTGWGYEDADLMQQLLYLEARFISMESLGIICYHLSHAVDKSNIFNNIELYNEKIKSRGRRFHLNHFFGVFENDGWDSSSSYH